MKGRAKIRAARARAVLQKLAKRCRPLPPRRLKRRLPRPLSRRTRRLLGLADGG